MIYLAGVDIGGTKCAISLGEMDGDTIQLLDKIRFLTPPTPQAALHASMDALDVLLAEHATASLDSIGVSCGGPLNSRSGLILSPPNLPGWDRVDFVSPLRDRYRVPVGLQNDANACALAEWKWGAGRGYENLVFLTFGTGMGAGFILNGQLYAGASDLAGEVGHIRLEQHGPTGHGKAGSFEGFCSGGGIAQIASQLAEDAIRSETPPLYCPTLADLPFITAETVARAVHQGDLVAHMVFEIVAHQLGRGLAILIDILNPQLIIIGSIYTRQQALLEPLVMDVLRAEALPQSLSACQIVPSALAESLGDLASLSVALDRIQ